MIIALALGILLTIAGAYQSPTISGLDFAGATLTILATTALAMRAARREGQR